MTALFCLLPLSEDAGKYTSEINGLSGQLDNLSAPVSSTALEEVAKVTYRVLTDIPATGLNGMQADTEGVIALRKKLEARPGILERLLAIIMQESVDCSLVYEVYRKALHLQGQTYGIPFRAGSLDNAVLASLAEKNGVSEPESVRYIIALEESSFAKVCRDNSRIGPDELLFAGVGIYGIPAGMADAVAFITSGIPHMSGKMDSKAMYNFVFAKTLGMIDKARDARAFLSVWLKDGGLPAERGMLHDKLESGMSVNRISCGQGNAGNHIFATIRLYIGDRRGRHPDEPPADWLSRSLLPYFRNPEDVIPAEIMDQQFTKTWIHENRGSFLELKE